MELRATMALLRRMPRYLPLRHSGQRLTPEGRCSFLALPHSDEWATPEGRRIFLSLQHSGKRMTPLPRLPERGRGRGDSPGVSMSSLHEAHSVTLKAKPEMSVDKRSFEEGGNTLESAQRAGPQERMGFEDLNNGFPAESGRMMLVDGSALVYRAYFKVQAHLNRNYRFAAKEGGPPDDEDVVRTLFSFLDNIVFLLLHWQPSHVAVMLDHPGHTFRDDLYSGYKKSRSPMPDALRRVFPMVESALAAFGLAVLKIPNVEADDVIATLSTEALDAGMSVKIASPDKDFFQLLCPRLTLLRPDHMAPKYAKGASGQTSEAPSGGGQGKAIFNFVQFREEDFRQKYAGLEPSQFLDLLALMGDKCDDVPGARGIGEKTAPKLLRKFGTIANLLSKVQEIPQKGYREAIIRSEDDIRMSYTLVQLKKDVPHGRTLESLLLKPPDNNGLLFWSLVDSLEDDIVKMGSLRSRIQALWLWLGEESSPC